MIALGPSLPYYKKVIAEFTKVEPPPAIPIPPLWSGLALTPSAAPRRPLPGLAGLPRYTSLAALIASPPSLSSLAIFAPPLTGALSKSSVMKNPTTQPFNNTSVILGVTFNGSKLLFTADAGSEALSNVSAHWNRLLYMGVPHHGSDGNLSQKDIERFCPQFATISAKGDSSHPSRAIVSGLVKVGTKLASTHKSGNLWFWSGSVPRRTDYGPVELLKGTGEPKPLVHWSTFLSHEHR